MNQQKDNKKILYLVNQFYMHGGIQRMLSHKIDAWVSELNYDVVVVTINQDNNAIVYPPKANFKLIDLDVKGVNQYNIRELFQFIRRIKRVIKSEQPDLLITTLTGIPSLILPLLSRKTKNVLEIHSSGALSVTKSWKNKWRFLKKYYKVILLNEDEKKYYELDNLAVIPNFVPIEETKNLLPFTSRENVIIAGGRIHPDKQYDHMVKIWELIYQQFPNWTLEVYGNGDAQIKHFLENYILEKSLERISFNTAVDNLGEKLKTSSIFLLTSDTECFPMVLVECKNAGLPAVSYDSPNGPRHIISNDGILVEHNNIEEFAEVLSALLNDEKKRFLLSENAFKNRVQFSAKTIIKEWDKLL